MRRKIEEILSEGRGKQLLWLLILTFLVIISFFFVNAVFFRKNSLDWITLLSQFLDPGCFQDDSPHAVFRLIATFCGMFLFSALLISVVSNIFENTADSFKEGQSRYCHKNHILILGGSHLLDSMVAALLDEKSPYGDSEVVVLTSQSVSELRTRLFSLSFLDDDKQKALKKRITLYHGDRDNELELSRKDLAKNARAIYIIGEDGEIDNDSISVRCSTILQKLCSNENTSCWLVLQDMTSMDVYKYIKSPLAEGDDAGSIKLCIDVINADEYLAEQVLVGDHDGVSATHYPSLDYRSIDVRDGEFFMDYGICEADDKYVHFVVAGMTDIAKAMAFTAAQICHFPNFKNGERRTVITFVDSDMKLKMQRFKSSLPGLFILSHSSYISYDETGAEKIQDSAPDPAYGDFLDVEWQFVDSDISDPAFRNKLTEWVGDKKQSLSIALCMSTQADNTFAALHLPRQVYESGCPIYTYQQGYADILKKAINTGLFGNLNVFGMASELQDDPLFVSRSVKGQKANFNYNQKHGSPKYRTSIEAWRALSEAHKMSNIQLYNALPTRLRSFNINDSKEIEKKSKEERQYFHEAEHRRWMITVLLLGYMPMDTKSRDEWKTRKESTDAEVVKKANIEFKELKARFIHPDINSYDSLPFSERDKDSDIMGDNQSEVVSSSVS